MTGPFPIYPFIAINNSWNLPPHSLSSEMVAMEQESWQVDGYLQENRALELKEPKITYEL